MTISTSPQSDAAIDQERQFIFRSDISSSREMRLNQATDTNPGLEGTGRFEVSFRVARIPSMERSD